MINSEKKIVISTSLKNFGDDENSRIQHLFLESTRKNKNILILRWLFVYLINLR